MLFESIKVCFIGVPKNASETMHQVLSEVAQCGRVHDHISMRSVILEYGQRHLTDYVKAGIVRNPYDRFASAYRYLRKHNDWQLSIDETLDFVEVMMSDKTHQMIDYLDPVLQPQTLYLCDEQGNVMVDMLLSFDNLQCDWERFKMVVPALRDLPNTPLPIVNSQSDGKTWIEMLTTAQMLRIAKIYDCDFTAFNITKSFIETLTEYRYNQQDQLK